MRGPTSILGVILLLLLIVASPATGQYRFGLQAGLNVADMGGDIHETGQDLVTGIEAEFGGTWEVSSGNTSGLGMGVAYVIPTSPTAGLQLEAAYIRRGIKYDILGRNITSPLLPGSVAFDAKFKLDYLEFPILMRYSPSPDAAVRPVFVIGVVPGIRVGADLEIEAAGTSQSQDAGEAFKDFLFGATGGIGLDARLGEKTHLLVQGRYFQGLVNQIEDPNLSLRSGDFSFFAGLEFELPNRGGATDRDEGGVP